MIIIFLITNGVKITLIRIKTNKDTTFFAVNEFVIQSKRRVRATFSDDIFCCIEHKNQIIFCTLEAV